MLDLMKSWSPQQVPQQEGGACWEACCNLPLKGWHST